MKDIWATQRKLMTNELKDNIVMYYTNMEAEN